MVHFWQLSLIVVAIFSTRSACTKFVPHPFFEILSEDDDFLSVPTTEGSFDKLSVADKIQTLISGWRQLNDQDRLEFFESLNEAMNRQESEADDVTDDFETARTYSTKVYDNIELYSYYSYLYYYPTMHWHLDKTPDTNNYWVGIYREGDSDKNYLAYQWIRKTAQGSYKIGELRSTAGMESRNRFEKFELRIFKGGYKRVDAVTNKLHGVVHSPPVEAYENDESAAKIAEEADYMPPLEPKLQAFLLSLETAVKTSNTNKKSFGSVQYSQEDLNRLWSQFDWQEQQLLLPILEQDSLPDYIKKPGLQLDDQLEPKVLYPDLGNKPTLAQALSAREPSKITLTITLDYSYTYVYPVVNTKSALSGRWAWLGLYYPKMSDISFGPKGYLRWQWVGPGYVKKTKLSYIKEKKAGTTMVSYVGPIFDWISKAYRQVGFASNVIQATVSATPAKPIPKFIPGYNVQEALTFAYLSKLAYKPYNTVKQNVKKYKLEAKKQIYDSHTDTNGFIASNSTTLVVVFRGTNIYSDKNILTNARFIKKAIDNSQVYCHGGFVDASNAVYTSIKDYVKQHVGKKKLFITGHSLGGALASILTYHLSKKYQKLHLTMYVYGCPPTCDKKFSDYFHAISSYVITIDGDSISNGHATTLGSWIGLYKPLELYFLQSAGGHGIKHYIDQLKKLQ